jgi:small subunit ribosomal protein S20
MKEAMKDARKEMSADALSKAFKAIDKAAKRGVIKKNTAARKKSRLAKALAKK